MPLHSGKSKEVISENIKEMQASGHPHDQAVAASLHNANPHNMAEGGFVDMLKKMMLGDKAEAAIKHDANDASAADAIDPVVTASTDTAKEPAKMADGGYPHVTFMEDQTPAQNKETTHLAKSSDLPQMAEGGTIHKAEDRNKEPAKPANIDMSHEAKLSAIYKAMGMQKFAPGGVVASDAAANGAPSGPPSPQDPGWMDYVTNMLKSTGSALGSAMSPIAGGGLADTTGKAVEAATPAIEANAPSISNMALGTNFPVPPAAPAPAAAPAMPPAAPTAPVAPAPLPAASMAAAKLPAQNPDLKNLFNQDTSKLTEGVNAEDRTALANKMQGQQHSLGSVIAEAVAGLGDAFAAKGGREQHSLKDIFAMQKEQRAEALNNFDVARQDRLQKLDLQTKMGNNAIQKLAAQDAYGTDEHLNKMLGAPPGTAHKDLPLYFQSKAAEVAKQEKDADLYMKAHAQASTDIDNAQTHASILGIKPSASQLQASGAKLADQYFNRAKGNVLFQPSDGQKAVWIPAQNMSKARQMDPHGQIVQ